MNKLLICAGFMVAIATFSAQPARAGGGEKWVCMLEGAEAKVKGKTPKEKKKACESKGGTWEKQQASAGKGTETPPAGGGW